MWLLDNQLKNITHAHVMKITGHLAHAGATLLSGYNCVATMSLSPIHLSSSSSSDTFFQDI
jgi:hypothetical protein